MRPYFSQILALLALCAFFPQDSFATYPSTILVNQFGEKSINAVVGGSTVDLSFTVKSTNGLGVTGLTGAGVSSVYMNTATTAATGNPNPPAGYIIVNLASKYSGFLSGTYTLDTEPVGTSTTAVASVSASTPYVIANLGGVPTSQSGWVSIGVPTGATAATGMAFVTPATLPTPAVAGSGTVAAPKVSGTAYVELVGDPTLAVSASSGAQFVLETLAPTGSPTTMTPMAPADGTIVHLHLVMKALASMLH